MKQYRWTMTGLVLALGLLFVTLFFDLDLFESFGQALTSVDHYEIDEFIFPSMIIVFFSMVDLIHYKRKQKVQEEKEQIYKAMVQASDHVLKNCLNQMLLIKYTAEETPGFDQTALEHFDTTVEETMDLIEKLGQINEVDRDKIGQSVDIKLFD